MFPIGFHIWVGRIHNIAILVATVGAIVLSLVSATPMWIKMGFYVLLCLWVPTMLIGWYQIRADNMKQHSRWMTRNFSYTAAAITLRLYALVTLGHTPYYLMVYLSLIHIFLTEMYLQYTDECDRKLVKQLFSRK